MRFKVIHGPNLNLLGTRQPEIYGSDTLSDLEDRIRKWGLSLGSTTTFAQSNDESELVGTIQEASRDHDAVILNVGGFTHTSVAIADAVASIPIPTVEVHLSDINRREPWRKTSLIRQAAVRQISGRGAIGYRDAMRHLLNRDAMPSRSETYGPHPDHIIDIRGDGPRVLLVHGGFWLNQWERDTMESLAVALANAGFTTGNLEYRRSPDWPESGHDVETAARWFGAEAGPMPIIGHSAGAYLAMWAARRRLLTPVVGLAPITDLADLGDHSDTASTLIDTGAPTLATPGKHDLLIHGTNDDLVAAFHSSRFDRQAEVHLLADVGHFSLLAGSGPHLDLITTALNRHFG